MEAKILHLVSAYLEAVGGRGGVGEGEGRHQPEQGADGEARDAGVHGGGLLRQLHGDPQHSWRGGEDIRQ